MPSGGQGNDRNDNLPIQMSMATELSRLPIMEENFRQPILGLEHNMRDAASHLVRPFVLLNFRSSKNSISFP
jgi:hypothetical protein